jgi:type II secretory pathway predicted ATPase ExeA
MYERFFGLRERPFDLVPNPRFLYLTGRQREALSNLRYGLTTPRGLTLLIGEAGTGKTTLVQAMLSEVDREVVECVLLSNPTLTRAEFYEFLAASFGLPAEAATSKTLFLFELRRQLVAKREAGVFNGLILDEAQSLPYELLEEVRLLSNIETPTEKLLNVVLAGQPELADRLNEVNLRQLKQRISLRCELGTFTFQETGAYIAGRLRVAGGEPAKIFTVRRSSPSTTRPGRTINASATTLIGGFAAGTPRHAGARRRSLPRLRSKPAAQRGLRGAPKPPVAWTGAAGRGTRSP